MDKLIRINKYFWQTINMIWQFNNWWIVYLNYFNLKDLSNGAILNLNNGLKFKIIHWQDAMAVNEVVLHKDYKFNKTNNPMTIIDIGANIGTFSVFASKLAPKSKIYAFEPSKKTFKQLLENIRLNKSKNIKPVNKAIFSKSSKFKLYNFGPSGQSSIYKKAQKNNVNYEEISAITLNNVFNKFHIKKIDFLKMDCEGSEYEILKNIHKSTFTRINRIAMEYHELNKLQNKKELKKILEKNGFIVKMEKHKIEPSIGYIWASRNN